MTMSMALAQMQKLGQKLEDPKEQEAETREKEIRRAYPAAFLKITTTDWSDLKYW